MKEFLSERLGKKNKYQYINPKFLEFFFFYYYYHEIMKDKIKYNYSKKNREKKEKKEHSLLKIKRKKNKKIKK